MNRSEVNQFHQKEATHWESGSNALMDAQGVPGWCFIQNYEQAAERG